MACRCENTECLRVYVSPCQEDIDILLSTEEAGEYLFILEFNGTFQRFSIDFEAAEDIVIPNCVNENYTHELQIFKPDGTLLNNTCYSLMVSQVTSPLIY